MRLLCGTSGKMSAGRCRTYSASFPACQSGPFCLTKVGISKPRLLALVYLVSPTLARHAAA
jgi:hypothetical protein